MTIHRVQNSEAATKGESWFGLAESGALNKVQSAILALNKIDVLDTTQDGTDQWQNAENRYNEDISKVENLIITRLRDKLSTCSTASDMFRCFSKFNALFIRPKIRGAIHEYQTLLIERVKDDIKKLHAKFTSQKHSSTMIASRDIPPVSAAIIWARQIQRQLALYMRRVEDVLGKGWEQYAEGQKLYQDDLAFQKQLDTTHIFNSWLAQALKQNAVKGHIFALARTRNVLELQVNFDSTLISIFKEVRNLAHLSFQIPHTIANLANDAKRIYPFAVALIETVRTYHKTLHLLSSLPHCKILVASTHTDVQKLLSRGMSLKWDYFMNLSDSASDNRHVVFVGDLSAQVIAFQDKVSICASRVGEINSLINSLATVEHTHIAFKNVLGSIQKIVDSFHFESFSNLEHWILLLDDSIEKKLILRLSKSMKVCYF